MWSLGKIANRVIKEMKRADTYEIVAICSSNLEKANNFIKNNKDGNICFILNIQSLRDMQFNTNLKRYYNE